MCRSFVVSLACAGLCLSAAPGADRPGTLHIRKVPVTDCRVVRGFLGTPVDGSVHSWDYRGTIREYPQTASDGVAYTCLNNDGLHVSLADGDAFNAIVLRGGAAARVYADIDGLAEPAGEEPLCRFAGGKGIETVRLPRIVKAGRVSFFGIGGGTVSDVAFYRIEQAGTVRGDAEAWTAE